MDDDEPREPSANASGDPGPSAAPGKPLDGPSEGEDPLYYFRRHEAPGVDAPRAHLDPAAAHDPARGSSPSEPLTARRLLLMAAAGSLAAAAVLGVLVLTIDAWLGAQPPLIATPSLPRIAAVLFVPPAASPSSPEAAASQAAPDDAAPPASAATIAQPPSLGAAQPPSLGAGWPPPSDTSVFLLPPPSPPAATSPAPPAATSAAASPPPPSPTPSARPTTVAPPSPSPSPPTQQQPNPGPLFQREN